MTARVVHAALVLEGRDLALAATSVQLAVNAARANAAGAAVSRELLELLDRMRDACSMSCATQLAQVAREDESPEWYPSDLITVREAAAMSGTTESNIRQRCGRGSLAAVKTGGEWRVSRASVLSAGESAAS